MRAKTTWQLARWAVLLTMALMLAGCDVLDQQLVIDWAEEWARAKNIHPRNEDGSINIGAGINLATRAAGFSTGDEDADAALDVFLVVRGINDADKLMDEGRQKHDPAPMDQAIAARPGDWTYRSTRAALALDQGDVATAQAQFDAADAIAADRGIDPLWYADQSIDDLQNAALERMADGVPGFDEAPQCRMYWDRMAQLWALRYSASHDAEDQALAADARAKVESCP